MVLKYPDLSSFPCYLSSRVRDKFSKMPFEVFDNLKNQDKRYHFVTKINGMETKPPQKLPKVEYMNL